MRTPSRLSVVAAVLGGGLLIAGPAAAQTTADCDEYPELAECQIDEDLGGNEGGAASGEGSSGGTAGGAASLPVTGGELTLIALAGVAAVGGGVALTVSGRKRSTV